MHRLSQATRRLINDSKRLVARYTAVTFKESRRLKAAYLRDGGE
jgi:hypothetical protein